MEQQMEQTFSMEQTTTFTEQTFSSNQEPQVTVTEQNFSTQSNNLQQPVNEKYQALSSDQMSNLDRPYVAGSGAATDDRFHQHSKLQQKNISELNYRAGHREQILGQRAQTELHGHPEYTHAQQQQINVSDNQYGAKASKMRSQINYGEGAMELTNAQKSAIRMKHEMNRMKESKEWNARGRAFNLEDPLDDVDSRMHAHNQQLRNLAYALGANEDNVDLYMPVTMTQQYQQQKDLKNKLHGGNYEDDARRAAMRPQFDLVQTEGYQSHKKLADTKTAYTQDYYNTKHENQMGKVLAQTAEVQQAAKNAKNLSDTQYKIGAEELRRLVQMNESPELSQARVNAHQLSKKAYKAGYMAMLQAKKDNRKLEDFPEYVQAKKAAAAASQKLYELEAKAMAEHPLGIDNQHYTIQNANKAAEVMNDSKYQKTKGEVIDTMKGYMTMPAEEHPIVTQGNFQKVMQSNALYKKDAADEATEVYFNAAETDHYDSIKKLDPIKSNKKYTLASIEENARPQYQQHETEKYQSDAKRTKLISEYSSIPHEAQGYEKALKETPAMKQAELAKKITSENYYKAGNRRLLEQYKPELDTPINRQSKMNSRIASQKAYKAAYEQLLKNRQEMRDVQGHLEYVNAKKVHEVTSDSLYKAVALKENETPKGVDLETPAIKQVKVNQNTVSDRLYKEGQAEVIAKNKAWQTMDPAGHPIVTQGNYHKAMMSDNNYALESKEDNAEVYYPANLTPGYEQSQTVRPYQSESNYKSDIHKNKDHEFNLATTESYEQNKKLNDVKMNYDKQFKEQQLAGNDYPSGMLQSELYLSQQRAAKNASDAIYTAGAKEIMKRNVLPNDNLYFLNNRKAQQQSSDLKYHEGYNEQVKGKASMNPIDCHLDYLQSAKNQTNMSDAAYQAGGEKIKHNYTMVREDIHIDTPIRVSKHTNQRDYEQSRIDAIKEYKGYMTMPADKHPLVKKAAHDNMLMSQAGYRADWDEDKLNTQYMVNATEHYQQIDNLKETLGSQYTRKATEEREHTNFNAADTQRYQDVLKLQEVNDSNYKKKYNEEISAGKGYMHMPAVTMEMTKNKALDLYRSDNIYSRAAKNLATKYGLTMDDQKMAHQLQVSDITSERLYKKGYNDQMKGKSVQDSGIAYPRYLELAKLARETRDSNYQKGARENLRSHTMGADSMVLAQQKLNSQAVDEYNYSKTRREVIATMKHYQTMDASLHPITLKTNLDRMLYSDAGYRQDWNQDKIEIDFRADGTPGYQQMQDLKPFLSKQEYERKGNKIKSEAKFNPVDTETYETIKNLNAVAGQKYTEKAAKFAEHPIGNANDEMMQISKKLAPILSSHRYTKAAKKLAEKYNISMDDQRIANALKVTDAVNNRIYKAAYQTQMLGKGPQDQKLENYPVEKAQYDLQQKVCDKNYRKHGNEIKMSGKLPLDYMGFTHVKNSAIIASDALYRRSRGDVIAKMKAWQNMDFKDTSCTG